MKLVTAGENALMIYFGEAMNPAVASQVQQAVALLEAGLGDLLIDLVPSYTSLLVIYDLFLTDRPSLEQRINSLLARLDATPETAGKLVELPVYYSSESGPDLVAIARRTGMTSDDIVTLHQAREYRVYAIGFAPGFAYLGEVDARLATPRLATPRARVPKGSVGIAEQQTAVYPADSPGGWNLIGRCPVDMFNPLAEPCMPVQVGDRVRFRAIDRADFLALGGLL
jgi:KipI family sensor histidine kinase inhibitor